MSLQNKYDENANNASSHIPYIIIFAKISIFSFTAKKRNKKIENFSFSKICRQEYVLMLWFYGQNKKVRKAIAITFRTNSEYNYFYFRKLQLR